MAFLQKIKPIILVSKSKTRREILTKAGVRFSVLIPKEYIEVKAKADSMFLSGEEKALFLARSKAKNFYKRTEYILASDQLAEMINGKIINKPNSRKEAIDLLDNISGKQHNLYTSAVLYHRGKEIWNTVQKVKIYVKNLSKKEQLLYLEDIPDQQLFSSGIYCVEKEGKKIINKIEGDYFSTLGFPLFPFLKFVMVEKKQDKY